MKKSVFSVRPFLAGEGLIFLLPFSQTNAMSISGLSAAGLSKHVRPKNDHLQILFFKRFLNSVSEVGIWGIFSLGFFLRTYNEAREAIGGKKEKGGRNVGKEKKKKGNKF